MSAAQTADRIVAGKFISADGGMRAGNDRFRADLTDRSIPVIVADNVAAYVNDQTDKGRVYRVGDWPCLAPPWSWAFLEYPSTTGNQRRGVYLLGFDLHTATLDERSELTGMIGRAIEDANAQSPGQDVRWALVLIVFVDDGRRVFGPMGSIIYCLDEHGAELGNRWFLRAGQWDEDPEEGGAWMLAASVPALQTIAFMHCKNVVVDRGQRDVAVAKAYKRRHHVEPMRWQTVRLELPRSSREAAGAGGEGGAPSLHIVSGHFAHYGNCCPSAHEPNGKLFGRLEGIYWMPQHLRGREGSEIRSDRVVTVKDLGS